MREESRVSQNLHIHDTQFKFIYVGLQRDGLGKFAPFHTTGLEQQHRHGSA